MTSEKLYDLEQLNAIAAGNDEFVNKMVRMFLDMTPALVERISDGVQLQDWAEVKAAAHKMKPSVDMMGITSLRDIVRTIELNSKMETNLEQMPDLYFKLSDTMEKVFEQLRAI